MRTSKPFVLNVERDSVSAGDDVSAPHTKQFIFQAKHTMAEAVASIVEAAYLPQIAGGKATWIVEAGDKPVAVVAQQWKSSAFLIDPAILISDYIRPEAPRSFFSVIGVR